jgi:Na+/H+ antiporter NhaC
VVPIGTVVVVVGLTMYWTGREGVLAEGGSLALRNVFGHADSLRCLLWGSLAGCVAAIAMAVGTRRSGLAPALDAWLEGLRAMVLACVILLLAWSLGSVCEDLKTAEYLVGLIHGWLSPTFLPAIVFVVAGVVSFATGTSWGTMAILFPLVIPAAHRLAPGNEHVVLSSIASILSGSVWGDHCSPISDTTILSSLASSSDHIDHVRTQLPYAVIVGLVALVVGDVATGMGLYPAWVGLLVGAGLLVGIVWGVARPVAEAPASGSPTAHPSEDPSSADGR